MKATLNPTVERLSGKIGGLTYRWMNGKQTVMKTPDMSSVQWSEAQNDNRRRFAEAIQYAHQALADSQVRAHYEGIAKKANRRPFRVAVSDYMKGIDLLKPTR
jgi:hypothetical protein